MFYSNIQSNIVIPAGNLAENPAGIPAGTPARILSAIRQKTGDTAAEI